MINQLNVKDEGKQKLAQSRVFKSLSMEAVLTFEEDELEMNLQVHGWADKVKETIQSVCHLLYFEQTIK